jgi:hypothetical protein
MRDFSEKAVIFIWFTCRSCRWPACQPSAQPHAHTLQRLHGLHGMHGLHGRHGAIAGGARQRPPYCAYLHHLHCPASRRHPSVLRQRVRWLLVLESGGGRKGGMRVSACPCASTGARSPRVLLRDGTWRHLLLRVIDPHGGARCRVRVSLQRLSGVLTFEFRVQVWGLRFKV